MIPSVAPTTPGIPCIACGYDLRNDPKGVCPECGVDFAQRDEMRRLQMQGLNGTQIGFMIAGLLLALPILVGFFLMVAYAIIAVVRAWT